MRTADFRDANNNGVDDRDEKTDQNKRYIKGQDPSSNPQNQTDTTGSNNLSQMYMGQEWGNSLMTDLFSNGGSKDDDGRRAMRDAFQFDVGSKFFNTQLGMAQSEFNLAQNKEGMAFANMLDRQTMQESRNHIFGLNMKTMDKQFSLNDEFANRDYGRNIGMLAATGEQTRKNYAAEGQQQRLGVMVAGEQTRQNLAVQGQQDRLGYRVQGQEQRANIKTTGVENRKQAITEGEQKRLNIGKTAEEERTTMSHSDNISAGREKRQTAAARAATRAF